MMIARLRGTVEDIGLDGLLVDVGGTGYLVQVSTRSRAALPPSGAIATLLIEMQIREDAITLFGFVDRAERDWFKLLTTVQGVGGKVALNILSTVEPDRLAAAILAQDKALLSRADGVGAKLAIRLVTELKDKAAQWSAGLAPPKTSDRGAPITIPASVGPKGAAEDAISALVNLGYRRVEAAEAVAVPAHNLGGDVATGELIRAGLKELSQ
jgi:Holliday junction DNA helicase RuvA